MTRFPPAMSWGLSMSLGAAVLLLPDFVPAAAAHPHDLLAQCQLQDGSWKMCDEVVHDPSSGNHVPKEAPVRIDSLKAAEPEPEPPRQLQIRQGQ